MKIKFLGLEGKCSFTKEVVYSARKAPDGLGGYVIKDDSGDTYRYGDKFVEDNFEIIELNHDENR